MENRTTLCCTLAILWMGALVSACTGSRQETATPQADAHGLEIQRCARALDPLPQDVQQWQDALAGPCGRIHRAQACRSAWQALLSAEAASPQAVMDACAAAYCPMLAAPAPALCAGDGAAAAGPEGRDGAPRSWIAFHTRVLEHEAGADTSAETRQAIQRVAEVLAAILLPVGTQDADVTLPRASEP